MEVFTKDPSAILDYVADWTSWLGPDTISASTWTVPAGLTKVTDVHDTKTATAWLSGGTAGTRYTVTNRIVTTAGRTEERSFVVVVRNR